jgi:hypothetical protein
MTLNTFPAQTHLNSWLLEFNFVTLEEIEQVTLVKNGTAVGLEAINVGQVTV